MSNRIQNCFERLQASNRAALVTYITAGDPSYDASASFLSALTEGGADIIELGVPFSDPMADGPIIQRASERALAAGMDLRKVLALVANFRAVDDITPIVLMGYLNPIEAMGYSKFAIAASQAGVDGLLIVDMPPEEAQELNTELSGHGVNQIFLVSPNSDDQRVSTVASLASGFIYYVSIKGVTGRAGIDVEEVAERINGFRSRVDLPIGVGFGIKTADAAAQVAKFSDAVIVGSVLVEIVENSLDDHVKVRENLRSKVKQLSSAIAASR